jgi:hypothetical protein
MALTDTEAEQIAKSLAAAGFSPEKIMDTLVAAGQAVPVEAEPHPAEAMKTPAENLLAELRLDPTPDVLATVGRYSITVPEDEPEEDHASDVAPPVESTPPPVADPVT